MNDRERLEAALKACETLRDRVAELEREIDLRIDDEASLERALSKTLEQLTEARDRVAELERRLENEGFNHGECPCGPCNRAEAERDEARGIIERVRGWVSIRREMIREKPPNRPAIMISEYDLDVLVQDAGLNGGTDSEGAANDE